MIQDTKSYHKRINPEEKDDLVNVIIKMKKDDVHTWKYC